MIPTNPSDEVKAALRHVEERIREDGSHDVRGCPRFCRAICPYREILERIEADDPS